MIDEPFRKQLLATFDPLKTAAAAKAFPPPRTLSDSLAKLVPLGGASSTRNVEIKDASHFSTAAVDMWLRSVHSFLISASLTEASPIWASVAGYYSSHYAVRGVAHLLGYFQLFRKKRVVALSMNNSRFVCAFRSKDANDAEHKLYWKIVKQSGVFQGDGFFPENNPDSEDSDVRHRNHANYADHLFIYPVFKPLSETALKNRIEFISKIVFDTPPLPRFSKFPDLAYVQLVAYHRLVRFRSTLDETLDGKNRFWNVHRNPSFASDLMDFQLAQGSALSPAI
jgi:hypothetical protein